MYSFRMRKPTSRSPFLDDALRLAAEVGELRRDRGISRADLAERARISRDTLTKIERGDTLEPGLFTVAALAAALQLGLDDLLQGARQRSTPTTPLRLQIDQGFVSIGYEGRTAEETVAALVARGVHVVADVRLNPISRKPGLSKNSLAADLNRAGIEYTHLKPLGNPRDNRTAFGTSSDARARFNALLHSPEGDSAMNQLLDLADEALVGVLCFERGVDDCHRQMILIEAKRRRPRVAVHHV